MYVPLIGKKYSVLFYLFVCLFIYVYQFNILPIYMSIFLFFCIFVLSVCVCLLIHPSTYLANSYAYIISKIPRVWKYFVHVLGVIKVFIMHFVCFRVVRKGHGNKIIKVNFSSLNKIGKTPVAKCFSTSRIVTLLTLTSIWVSCTYKFHRDVYKWVNHFLFIEVLFY